MVAKHSRNPGAFGQKLSSFRQKKGLTMRALAQKSGVSVSFISLLEMGSRFPSRQFIENLADSLAPHVSSFELDELLLAGGFTPIHFRNFTNREDVITIYQRLLKKDPHDFKTFIALVVTLIKTQQFDLANQKITEGFEFFDDSIQMQCLLAILELSKQNFEQAIACQQEALKGYLTAADRSLTQVSHEDLLLHLGVIYFMQGYGLIDQKIIAEIGQDLKAAKKTEKLALGSLHAAADCFHQALAIVPDDLYILDEYARVNFNLAYMMTAAKAKPFWKKAIHGFCQVLMADNKHLLGYENLVQSNIFLAHAYAKNAQFDEADFHINIIESCLPNSWLVSYIKCCCLCLKFESQANEAYLTKALVALHKAVHIQDAFNRAYSEAWIDPDLKVLREHRHTEFMTILEPESPEP